jgi:PAS domain S-box-containing protein
LVDTEKEFTNILQTENIDLILSDYSLPLYSGKQALKLAHEKYAHIPFILVSGAMGEDTAITCMLDGATDCVLKRKLDKLGPSIKRALLQTEEAKKHNLAELALKNSEIRYRRLFESAKNGILILDAVTGKVIDVNQALIELMGYSKEKFIEKTLWEIDFFKVIVANYEKYLELRQKEYVRYDNVIIETATGNKINIEFLSNVYSVNQQKAMQCHIRVNTEQKKAENKTEQMSESQINAV